jgi:hypothetical protein
LRFPRLDEADASTGFAGNVGRDPTQLFANQAARSEAAARWLESATLVSETTTDELRVRELVASLARYAEASRRADAGLRSLGIHVALPDSLKTKPALARLVAPESRENPLVADALELNQRCGFLLADPAADHPECRALVNLVAHVLGPAEVSMKSHIADSLAELAAIHSPDARAEKALRAVEALARDAAALLLEEVPDGPAATLVTRMRGTARALGDARGAADDVKRSAESVRSMCR